MTRHTPLCRPRLPARGALAITVLALALVTTGCSRDDAADGSHWNVVFVMVDTLRADHLSLFGYDRETSPGLERLADSSYVFPTATSQAGCTYPSVNSLLTSKYASHFEVPGKQISFVIPPEIPSIAEILSDYGYDTTAISASPIVRATPSRANRHGGFGRGFSVFDEECLEKDASCVDARAETLLSSLEEPFFLYLHYFDPHGPYHPPLFHVRAFPDAGPISRRFIANGNLWPIVRMIYHGAPDLGLTDTEIAQLRTLYDEEIVHWDWTFSKFLHRLETQGLLDHTILVLVADHGEEILDHGYISHCRDLAFQTLIHTPMLWRIPGLPGGVRQARVENLDVVPTLLDYLGIPTDGLGLEGKSLRPVIEHDRQIHRYVFAAQGKSRVVSDGRWKLLYNIESATGELFDLANDPGETRDLAAEHPEEAGRLREVLFRWIHHLEGAVGSDEALRRAQDTENALKAVGYL